MTGTERTIHILNTGGTISYARDGSGLTYHPEKILAEIGAPRRVVYRDVLRKGSVNMTPGDWLTIAVAVHEALRSGADGVVVFHGTDTMAFTAAALSFMLQTLSVPVVLTGSMRPGGAPDSDASENVQNALSVAASADLGEVCIVFSRDETGSGGVILRGNRARKMNSMALNAFASPNHPPLGQIQGETIRYDTPDRVCRGPRGSVTVSPRLNSNVCLIRYHPGCPATFLADALSRVDGAVIEGTGLGHLPTEGGILDAIRLSGKPVVLVSACWQGGVRLGRYDVDRDILAIENLIPGSDLTPEAALVKLMWVLGEDRALQRVRARMQEPVAGELTPERA
jgi:L-asparaginase type I